MALISAQRDQIRGVSYKMSMERCVRLWDHIKRFLRDLPY